MDIYTEFNESGGLLRVVAYDNGEEVGYANIVVSNGFNIKSLKVHDGDKYNTLEITKEILRAVNRIIRVK